MSRIKMIMNKSRMRGRKRKKRKKCFIRMILKAIRNNNKTIMLKKRTVKINLSFSSSDNI
jgi:hypothetical protein